MISQIIKIVRLWAKEMIPDRQIKETVKSRLLILGIFGSGFMLEVMMVGI